MGGDEDEVDRNIAEPGRPLTLALGGYRIMLMGLKQTLNKGNNFPITITFAKAG